MRKRECYMKRRLYRWEILRHRQAVPAAVSCSCYLFFIFYIIVTTTTVAQVRFDEQTILLRFTSYLVAVQLFQATLYAY